jgi:lycopene cyclase domain-containing protein
MVFFAVLALIMTAARKRIAVKALAVALLLVVGLTALFDPIMIAVGLVAYDPDKLLGLHWLGAPIEDFAYALFAVPFVACLWHLLERRDD